MGAGAAGKGKGVPSGSLHFIGHAFTAFTGLHQSTKPGAFIAFRNSLWLTANVQFQRDAIGTVYFSEDMTEAENAIQEVLSDYDVLLKQMNEDQKRSVVRTIG